MILLGTLLVAESALRKSSQGTIVRMLQAHASKPHFEVNELVGGDPFLGYSGWLMHVGFSSTFVDYGTGKRITVVTRGVFCCPSTTVT